MTTRTTTPLRTDEDAARTSAGRGVRRDIQGLRALAVTLVLVFHLWPHALPGGFVGVDVFFVISGFLITSHLLGHLPRTGRDLAGFWARRIRRLLPASLLVLLVTLVASRIVAPETQWATTAKQVAASALYVENWVLASDSVDYLAAENAPSPVQHYWSLSVEEQFYLVWPVLVLVLAWLARRRLARLRAVGLGLGVVVAGSFAYSVWASTVEPARAYFVTPTRIWELGAGALFAVAVVSGVVSRRAGAPQVRSATAWTGLALIAWAAFRLDGATPFPSWWAAIPVVGAVLVIAADAPARGTSPVAAMATRPVQWLGDVSYSVYLWHWPLVVLVPYVSGGHLGALDAVAIVVATLVLAGVTKAQVEDRFRTPRGRAPLRTAYTLAAVGMAVVVGLALVQGAEVAHRQAEARDALAAALAGDDPCFGAAALDDPAACPVPSEVHQVVPALAQAPTDKSRAYPDVSGGKDCWSYVPSFPTVRCTFGDPDGDVEVALVGNSHAGQWLPAVEAIAGGRGWRVTTYLASRCALVPTEQRFATGEQTARCRAWGEAVSDRVQKDRPDVVLVANQMSAAAVTADGQTGAEAYEAGYEALFDDWARAGLSVVALRDTPYPKRTVASIPDCLAEELPDAGACSGDRDTWLTPDPIGPAAAAVASPRITYADLSDHVCRPERCEAVEGGVVVYFDASHLTATYALTLAPVLDPLLVEAASR